MSRVPDIMHLAESEVKVLLTYLIEHRKACEKDIRIKQTHAPGLGTNTFVVCDCQWEFNVTDYTLW
jgi:hypothetical protein